MQLKTVKWPEKHWLKHNFKKDYIKFFQELKLCSDFNYLYLILKFYTAPTVYGKKIGTLINLNSNNRDLCNCFIKHKEFFEDKFKLNSTILRSGSDNILVYYYRSKDLKKRLCKRDVISFLKSMNYNTPQNINDSLKLLCKRFEICNSCPHEIGIFLGYPLKDVTCFSSCNDCFRYVGYWKCYENVLVSKCKFFIYDFFKWIVAKSFLIKKTNSKILYNKNF